MVAIGVKWGYDESSGVIMSQLESYGVNWSQMGL